MLVVGRFLPYLPSWRQRVQSDAGAGSGLFFCSFRPTFALLGPNSKLAVVLVVGVCWPHLALLRQSSNLVLVLVVELFRCIFGPTFAILSQISNLAVVLVVGGVFGKVAVFPKVFVGVSSAFLWGFLCANLAPPRLPYLFLSPPYFIIACLR